MRRALALLALAAAAALAARLALAPQEAPDAAAGLRAAAPAARGAAALRVLPRLASGGCKPLAPVEITWVPDGADGAAEAGGDGGVQAQPPGAGTLTVDFTIRPLFDMQAVAWAWELSPGVMLLDGEPSGTAQPEAAALTAGSATLSVPNDGGHHAAALIVTAGFAGSGTSGPTGPETIRVASSITWGELPPAVPQVLTPDGPGGAWAPVAVVPVSHEAAP